jgi:hypothetical protein
MTAPSKPAQDEMPPSSVLEPEYAVGKGLISQDEFNAMKNEFFSESELSVGLILPLILLASAASYWMLPWMRIVLAIALSGACGLLYMVGVERRFQYRFELKILILGRWDKAKEAAQKSSSSNSSGGNGKKPPEEKLSIAVDLNPLTVDFRTGSTDKQPAAPTPPLPRAKT